MAEARAKLWKVDAEARRGRRTKRRVQERTSAQIEKDGTRTEQKREVSTSLEEAEARAFVASLARNFAACVEFYKTEPGGSLTHAEAAKTVEDAAARRCERVAEVAPKDISWSDLSAVARERGVAEALAVWAKLNDAADGALAAGLWSAEMVGARTPYARAEFLAIRHAFADQWQPRGGIESAMIDQLTIAFSLQMYWSGIAHARATERHDRQEKEIKRFEVGGWKSPFQSEAEAVEQAHRLADGYNRQFLRVLRQLRDLRRYAPPVIVNNGGQVNVAANGGQQVNVTQPDNLSGFPNI